jgi:hypothetical protein
MAQQTVNKGLGAYGKVWLLMLVWMGIGNFYNLSVIFFNTMPS